MEKHVECAKRQAYPHDPNTGFSCSLIFKSLSHSPNLHCEGGAMCFSVLLCMYTSHMPTFMIFSYHVYILQVPLFCTNSVKCYYLDSASQISYVLMYKRKII